MPSERTLERAHGLTDMAWLVGKVPETRSDTVAFLRGQVLRILKLAHHATSAAMANEFLSLAAFLHKKAQELESAGAATTDQNRQHDRHGA